MTCENGGTCNDLIINDEFECVCADGFEGEFCENVIPTDPPPTVSTTTATTTAAPTTTLDPDWCSYCREYSLAC